MKKFSSFSLVLLLLIAAPSHASHLYIYRNLGSDGVQGHEIIELVCHDKIKLPKSCRITQTRNDQKLGSKDIPQSEAKKILNDFQSQMTAAKLSSSAPQSTIRVDFENGKLRKNLNLPPSSESETPAITLSVLKFENELKRRLQ